MNYKKVLYGLFLSMVLVVPVSAHALTLSELINLFVGLGIIPQEKAALALQLGNEKTTPTPVVSTSPVVCPTITRGLHLGLNDAKTGGEVTLLQQYLRSTGDYTYPSITGYYGLATEAAVKKWQARNAVVSSGTGVSTGYGVVGPLTRRIMKERCTVSGVQASFSATPTLGTKPLSVTFTGTVTDANYGSGVQINFGDGATGVLCSAGARCVNSTLTHTYTSIGTYTATFLGVDASKGTTTLGSTQVTVTNEVTVANATSFVLSPTYGSAPLVVRATIYSSLQNQVSITGPVIVGTINWGDGRSDIVTLLGGEASHTTISHVYSGVGVYTVTFTPTNGGSVTTSTVTVNTQISTAQPSLTFTSPTTGVSIKQGEFITLRWNTTGISSDTKMLLTLRTAAGDAVKSTSITDIASGSYTFAIPTATDYCNNYFSDAISPCGILKTGNYHITAAIVTPHNACVGFCAPTSPAPTTIVTADTVQFSLLATNATTTFSATPTSGTAPLTVSFSSRISGQSGQATIEYGDGTTENVQNCYAPNDYCITPGVNTHTYQSAGTYTARLLLGGSVLGTTVITVSNTTASNNLAPRGWLDGVSCSAVTGWAQDTNMPETAIGVHFYIDGPAGSGTFAGAVTANVYRTDLCSAIGSCSHGFSFPVPAQYRDNQSRAVYAYGIDTSTENNNALLTGSPKTFQCAP